MWIEQFKAHLRDTADFWVGKNLDRYSVIMDDERQLITRKKQMLKDRNAEIMKSVINGSVLGTQTYGNERKVDYACHLNFLIKQKKHFYIEESVTIRQAQIVDEEVQQDRIIWSEGLNTEVTTDEVDPSASRSLTENALGNESRNRGFYYNRLEAVRYAEKWWNTYNPKFNTFEVDCTNFISQCLLAGESPMSGQPNRQKGWWYDGNNWSFSWAVAHSLRWYLSGAKSGLRAKEVDHASQLVPGDVICYDFEGDGRWDHSTIVTEKDAQGMPLVNAHTTNSRHRYWSYEDSSAWTSNIQYKFFNIADQSSFNKGKR